MILLKKKEDMTDEEFAKYLLHAHAPLVRKLPGTRKYVINIVKKPPECESQYQGVVELWFGNILDMKKAFASPDGHITSEDARKFSSSTITLYVDEYEIAL